jgi:glucose-6-phosphate 1-dehydrogenase
MEKIENQILVIFGASGDLTKRKLIPSLFQLYERGMLPKKFAVLGVARSAYSDEQYRELLKEAFIKYTKPEEASIDKFEEFLNLLYYQSLETTAPESYEPLKVRLLDLSASLEIPDNFLYYLSTPPALYEVIPKGLKEQGLHKESAFTGFRRIIIEKPFGYDLKSAQKLHKVLKGVFQESQIYRIDHYLGKETVQNILVLRFANGIFENLWNRNFIERVEVTAIENLSIEGRGGYYDKAGALRDMVQNHLAQLVALTAMEPPSVFNAESFRNEVVKVYQAIRPMSDHDIRNNVIRGQYIASTTAKGDNLGYREEEGVDSSSRTETYVAMKMYIDNFRWQGVPFYIRTGKQMPTKVSEIVVHFKPLAHRLFKCAGCGCNSCTKLIIRIQPDEGIQIKFGVKIPGSGFSVHQASMDFKYENVPSFSFIDAYSRLLLDGMQGDSTLFTRTDAVETSWAFFDSVLKLWEKDPDFPLYGYPAGTWGPKEADALMPDSYWTNPCKNLTNTDLYCEL